MPKARYVALTATAILLAAAALSACSEDQAAPGTTSAASVAPSAPVASASPAASASIAATASPVPTPTAAPSASPSAEAASPSPSAAVTQAPSPSAAAKPAVSAPAVKPGKDTKAYSWYYMKKKDHQVPGFPGEVKDLSPNKKAVWVGTGKTVYLTFDTGGPMGESDKLLQILKDNDVKVTFFLVGYNVKAYPDFAKKVVEEGHTIGNHTMTHKDMTEISEEAAMKEIDDFAALIKETTGKPVAQVFRFPYGKYSMRLLDLVSEKGYTSVFWSTAMRDWEPRAGGAEEPYNDIMNGLHEGNIILMHQGSEENIEALDRIIKDVKKEGYSFGTLDELMQ
ncbi:polysaccharide deacetylase family protein [Paenibacillus mesotrionivorans]|uniref:Polysaccharide deacetylase family protein n=1 Tax=Paenibacillus mesotrionivorans TaxID=3160968 RepID=A0ACC7P2M0_9BACL